MPTPKKRAIGEMNGTNAALFRFLLISYPFLASALLTWGAWVTVSVSKFNAFIQYGARFSVADAQDLEKRAEEHSNRNMSSHVRDLHRIK